MKNKDRFIEDILKDIYNLSAPKLDESRRNQIFDIINIVVNGDNPAEYLVSDVNIKNKLGVYVYILTNNRLIIVTIDTQDEINTYPFSIVEMNKLSFKSPEPDMMSVEIKLSDNKSFGLTYPANRNKITSFFQALDQVLIKQKQL